jgi:3,4-dihydroxy-2-butanone 4-phosphate synthase
MTPPMNQPELLIRPLRVERHPAVAAAAERLSAGAPVVLDPGRGSVRPATVAVVANLLTAERLASLLRTLAAPVRVALTPAACERLDLRDEVSRPALDPHGAMSVHGSSCERHLASVEASEGVTTGISAADRVRTISLLADPAAQAADLSSPGHILPICAEPGEPTSAGRALALCVRAGITPCVLLCPVLDDAGELARGASLARATVALGGSQILEAEIDEAVHAVYAAGYWWT